MDKKQINKEKVALQRHISESIMNFQVRTGVWVESVVIEEGKEVILGDGRAYRTHFVDVKLDKD